MKIVKILATVLTIIIAVMGIAFTAIIIFSYSTGNSLFAVSSKSMEPTLKVGDLIITKPVSLSEIKENDILTFRSNTDPKITFTHRVVKVDGSKITTKGDASEQNDPSDTDFAFCVGKLKNKLPFLGYIYMLVDLKYGIYIIVILILIYASLELEHYYTSKKNNKQKALNSNE